jgi:hypothetical protein
MLDEDMPRLMILITGTWLSKKIEYRYWQHLLGTNPLALHQEIPSVSGG